MLKQSESDSLSRLELNGGHNKLQVHLEICCTVISTITNNQKSSTVLIPEMDTRLINEILINKYTIKTFNSHLSQIKQNTYITETTK